MSFFTKIPDYWQRLDWQILRDGGIHLYWRREYLLADTEWFSKHDYEISEFDCDTWTSQDVMFSEFARLLRLPDYFGRNLDALDECIQDLPLTESRGALLVLRGFDTYAAAAGSVPTEKLRYAELVLDIIARARSTGGN